MEEPDPAAGAGEERDGAAAAELDVVRVGAHGESV
jgi:hypothetical protein